jgi:hypothetical protein
MGSELPIACTLGPTDAQTRQQRWLTVAHDALLTSERTSDGARQIYRADPAVERELEELIDLEAQCCAFLDFSLTHGGDRLTLEVSGPPEAGEIVALFAAAPHP